MSSPQMKVTSKAEGRPIRSPWLVFRSVAGPYCPQKMLLGFPRRGAFSLYRIAPSQPITICPHIFSRVAELQPHRHSPIAIHP